MKKHLKDLQDNMINIIKESDIEIQYDFNNHPFFKTMIYNKDFKLLYYMDCKLTEDTIKNDVVNIIDRYIQIMYEDLIKYTSNNDIKNTHIRAILNKKLFSNIENLQYFINSNNCKNILNQKVFVRNIKKNCNAFLYEKIDKCIVEENIKDKITSNMLDAINSNVDMIIGGFDFIDKQHVIKYLEKIDKLKFLK